VSVTPVPAVVAGAIITVTATGHGRHVGVLSGGHRGGSDDNDHDASIDHQGVGQEDGDEQRRHAPSDDHEESRTTTSSATPATPMTLTRRQGQPTAVIALADKALQRLHRRFARLTARGKAPHKAVVAVGRELVGFVWAALTLREATA
jgi:hypothetical protein